MGSNRSVIENVRHAGRVKRMITVYLLCSGGCQFMDVHTGTI